MRRFVKYMVWALLAAVIIPIGSLSLYALNRQAEIASFYGARPILNSVNAVHDGIWTNDSRSARGALLERFPIGTELNTAFPTMKGEGFECAKPAVVSDAQIGCQLLAPALGGSTRWIVHLWFDDRNRLTDAKVAAWNISF